MNVFEEYIQLMKIRPDLFRNLGEPGEIKIIHDPERILSEQKRIQAELCEKKLPEHYIDIGLLSEDQWFWVVRDMVEFPNGKVAGYIRFINRSSNEQGGFNVIMMCARGDQVLMIRKFHHEERGWNWEFPRGFGEPNLPAEENALKELKEEVGVIPSRLTLLTSVTEEKGGTAVFYAEIPLDQEISVETGEGIASFKWVSMSELDELVRQGKLSDWFSLWAYVLAKSQKTL